MATLWDLLNERSKYTKQEFGDIMHDDSVSDEEKFRVLKEVDGLGGYENLGD